MSIVRMITGFAAKPSVSLIASIFLVIAVSAELGETLFSFAEGVRGEHGIFMFGMVSALKSLGEINEGLTTAGEALSE